MFLSITLSHCSVGLSYLSGGESCVVKHGGGGASGVGMGAPIPASYLCQARGSLGGGGASVDGPGWGRRAGGSWEPDVLVPGPVVGWGLSVGLLGKLVNLGQRGS